MAFRLRVVVFAASLSVITGCAVVPPESVKLSSTVGQSLAEIKKSHVFYIHSFYERLEEQASHAVDQVYAPAIIAAALNGKSGKVLYQKLEEGKKGGADANDAIAFTARFLDRVRQTVEAERHAAITPIKQARASALANVEAAYAQALQGNATVTAYLASIVKIRESQDELFATIGLPGIQDEAANELASASDRIAGVLREANDREAKVEELKQKIEKILKDEREK